MKLALLVLAGKRKSPLIKIITMVCSFHVLIFTFPHIVLRDDSCLGVGNVYIVISREKSRINKNINNNDSDS